KDTASLRLAALAVFLLSIRKRLGYNRLPGGFNPMYNNPETAAYRTPFGSFEGKTMRPEFADPIGRPPAVRGGLSALLLAACAGVGLSQDPVRAPVQVKIQDQQPVVAEAVLPLDPIKRINYQPMGMAVQVRSETNKTLHLSHFPSLNIDGNFLQNAEG